MEILHHFPSLKAYEFIIVYYIIMYTIIFKTPILGQDHWIFNFTQTLTAPATPSHTELCRAIQLPQLWQSPTSELQDRPSEEERGAQGTGGHLHHVCGSLRGSQLSATLRHGWDQPLTV